MSTMTVTDEREAEAAARIAAARRQNDAENKARRLACTHLVEATSFEQHCVWAEWHYRVPAEFKRQPLLWEQISLGFWQVIGYLDEPKREQPVSVTVTFARVNGALVGFYEATSRFVDHDMVKDWMRENFPAARSWSNAQNFHNIVLDIERRR